MKYSNARNDQNPMLFAPADFIWDAMKLHGKTVRSFGERGLNTFTPSSATWTDFYNDYANGTNKVKIEPRAVIMGLRDVYSPNLAAAESRAPDVMRAQGFLREFAGFEKNGNLRYRVAGRGGPASHSGNLAGLSDSARAGGR